MVKNSLRILLVGIIICCTATMAAGNDFEKFMGKIRKDFIINPSKAAVDEALKYYDSSKGCFSDIDYSRDDRTKWPPLNHLTRLKTIVYAYTNPKNPMCGDEKLYTVIVDGFNYWYEVDPQCHNWWYNQIAEPQLLGILMIQMRTGKKQLPYNVEEKTLSRMKQDGGNPAKWTGANRTDIALHWLYRACLTEDEETLKISLENAFSPLCYTTKEGFQYDNSYFQHGRQLYIGGYGDEIIKGVTQFAIYADGTKYRLPEEKLELLSKFMRQTYYKVIRGKYMSFDVLGRSVSRPNILNKSFTAKYAKRMLILDPKHADEYKSIIRRLKGKALPAEGVKSSHTHYYVGHYSLHTRPEYSFDVRMNSVNASRCEYGNKENLKTYFLADGCTNIVRNGDEYYNIFPVWNWTMIPGTTAPQVAKIPMAPHGWAFMGSSKFAGGVSDGLYGASGYSYFDVYKGINTGANKSWFFFDDEIVCLGSVSSTSGDEIITTINQCKVNEQPVYLGSTGKYSEFLHEELDNADNSWAFHNGIGYILSPYEKSITPKKGSKHNSIFIRKIEQKGTWYDINHVYNKKINKHQVFSLGINHGIKPENVTYSYIIVPTVNSPEELIDYAKKRSIHIVENTENIQSVYHKGLGIWQTVFFEAGTVELNSNSKLYSVLKKKLRREKKNGLKKGLKIEVSAPCILMLNAKNELYVADPSMELKHIDILIFGGRTHKKLRVELPYDGIHNGKTVKIQL